MDMLELNEEIARKLLEEWQQRLGLLDWAIALKINCIPEDMESDDVAGETNWVTSIKCATIRIMSEQAHGNDRVLPYDFEKTLVHELLHLKFGLLDQEINSYESKVSYEVMHQLIDDLARALVMTKRGQVRRTINCEIVQDKNKKAHECCGNCKNEIDVDKLDFPFWTK